MLKPGTRLYTVEDLEKLDGLYELDRGTLLGPKVLNLRTSRASRVTSRMLEDFVEQHDLGEIFEEASCVLARGPDTVRLPDVCFISAARMATLDLDRFVDKGPDLAIEVRSPSNTLAELRRKMQKYFDAGTLVGWILDPRSMRAYVSRPGEVETMLSPTDTIDAEPAIPGFRCVVRDLFERKKRKPGDGSKT